MQPQKKQLKMFGIGFLCALILSVTMFAVYAQTLTTMTLTHGIYPTASTHTVFSEGSNYYAKNAYGNIDYSGTNASLVINNALDSLGEVFIKSGIYLMDGSILVHSNTLLHGEGKNTIFSATSSSIVGMIEQGGFVNVAPFGSAANNVTIRDLCLYGNGLADSGIKARINNLHVENCYFNSFKWYFVKVLYSNNVWILNNLGAGSAGDGFHVLWCNNNVISGNRVSHVYDNSIANVHSSNSSIESNIIEGWASGSAANLAIWGNCHHVVVGNNYLTNSFLSGILVTHFESYDPTEISLTENQIVNSGYYGIEIISTVTGNDTIRFLTIMGNTINKTQRAGIYILGAGYSKLIGNTILDVGQLTDNTYDGVTLDYSAGANTYSNSWVIEGNQIYKTLANDPRYGIFLTSSYHICIGNHVTAGQTAKIQNNSALSEVDHNLEVGLI